VQTQAPDKWSNVSVSYEPIGRSTKSHELDEEKCSRFVWFHGSLFRNGCLRPFKVRGGGVMLIRG